MNLLFIFFFKASLISLLLNVYIDSKPRNDKLFPNHIKIINNSKSNFQIKNFETKFSEKNVKIKNSQHSFFDFFGINANKSLKNLRQNKKYSFIENSGNVTRDEKFAEFSKDLKKNDDEFEIEGEILNENNEKEIFSFEENIDDLKENDTIFLKSEILNYFQNKIAVRSLYNKKI